MVDGVGGVGPHLLAGGGGRSVYCDELFPPAVVVVGIGGKGDPGGRGEESEGRQEECRPIINGKKRKKEEGGRERS